MPLIEYPVPDTETPDTVTSELPVLDRVSVRVAGVPTVTVPKERLVGDAVRVPEPEFLEPVVAPLELPPKMGLGVLLPPPQPMSASKRPSSKPRETLAKTLGCVTDEFPKERAITHKVIRLSTQVPAHDSCAVWGRVFAGS